MPRPVFAVVDGGHFDDVSTALARAGLPTQSLFLGHGAQGADRFGPWLVAIRRSEDVASVLGIVGDLPAVVFWSCPGNEQAGLYQHLRRLNMVRIPAWSVAGKEGPDEANDVDLRPQTVLFRHWDPRVLGNLLPVLDEGQFSRIIGPAQEIAFVAAEHGGLKRVLADSEWPIALRSPLTISSEQMLELARRRLVASQRRQAAYLRRVAPAHVDHLSDAELLELAGQHQSQALGLGIRADRETFMWSFMQVTTRGDLSREPGIVRLMANPAFGPTPEARLSRLYDMRTGQLRQRG